MSLQKTLEELSNYSKNIASVRFKRGNGDVIDQLISRKHQCVRDARPNEVKLATYCNNEDAFEK